MLKDEYHRLINLFNEAAAGKMVKLEEVFRQSLEFFEHLKVQIHSGSPEEKKEALAMMMDMYTVMMEKTKEISQRSGLSEEQLLTFADNPSNFTPEQWMSIQDSKDKIFSAGQDIAQAIHELADKAPKNGPVLPLKEQKHAVEKKKPGEGNRPKKSKWLKS